jgi:hypothetical protein
MIMEDDEDIYGFQFDLWFLLLLLIQMLNGLLIKSNNFRCFSGRRGDTKTGDLVIGRVAMEILY